MTNWFSKFLWLARRPQDLPKVVKVQPATIIDIIGWWQFDTIAEAMVQRGTGDRLVWRGSLADDEALGIKNSATSQWLRFDVERDSERYPLVVEVRDVVDYFRERPLIWRIDYNRSAELNARQPLPFGKPLTRETWIKLDSFAIEALAFWPERSCTGVPCTAAEGIGSWYGEIWEAERVRRVPCGLRKLNYTEVAYADRNGPPVEPPQRWEFVEPIRDATSEERRALVLEFVESTPDNVMDIVKRIADINPHLRSESNFFIPFVAYSNNIEWIYADKNIITNIIHANFYKDTIQNKNVIHVTYKRYHNYGVNDTNYNFKDIKSANYNVVYRLINGKFLRERVISGSQDIFDNLRIVIEYAIQLWPHYKIYLYSYTGEDKIFDAYKIDYALFKDCICVAGTIFRLDMITWVDDKRLNQSIDLSAQSISHPIRNNGNLLYDAETVGMRSSQTGQSFWFENCLEGSSRAAEDQVSRFMYEDAECAFPVIVRRNSRKGPHFGGTWTIDHIASADAWREFANQDGVPPFGLWCRVCAFATGAITHFPDTEDTGPSSFDVFHTGGWMGGVWLPAARRKVTTGRLNTDAAPVAYDLMPLDRASPPTWTKVVNGGRYAKDTPLIHGDPELPPEWDPSDMEGLVRRFLGNSTYYVRDDGQAVFFCSGYVTRIVGPEARELTEWVYEYVDKYIRYRTLGNYLTQLNTYTNQVGKTILAHDQKTDSIYSMTKRWKYAWDKREYSLPSPVASQIILEATEGIVVSCADQAVGVSVTGHYTAGLWYSYGQHQVWIEDGTKRPHIVLP